MGRVLYLSLAVLLTVSLTGYAQEVNLEFQKFYDDFNHLKRFNDAPESKYEGSPYFNDEFVPGKIILSDGQVYHNIPLRYNIYSDQFEFEKNKNALGIERGKQFPCFIIGDRTFRYSEFKFRNKTEEGYLEQIIEGEYSLYLKYTTTLREAVEEGAFQEAKKPSFFPQKPVFMIGYKTNRIVEVRSSRDLDKEFQDLGESLNKFKGKNKLKLKSKEDYIELITYLNSNY